MLRQVPSSFLRLVSGDFLLGLVLGQRGWSVCDHLRPKQSGFQEAGWGFLDLWHLCFKNLCLFPCSSFSRLYPAGVVSICSSMQVNEVKKPLSEQLYVTPYKHFLISDLVNLLSGPTGLRSNCKQMLMPSASFYPQSASLGFEQHEKDLHWENK